MSVNSLVFTTDAYKSESYMWEDIARFLSTLMANEYIATIRRDEEGIFVIDYEHDESYDAWGCENPYWMTSDDHYDFECFKEANDGTYSDSDYVDFSELCTISSKDYPETLTTTASNFLNDKNEYINENSVKCSGKCSC